MISQDLQNKLINFHLFFFINSTIFDIRSFFTWFILVIIVIYFLFWCASRRNIDCIKIQFSFVFIILFDNYSSVFIFFKYKLNTKRFILFSFRIICSSSICINRREKTSSKLYFIFIIVYLFSFNFLTVSINLKFNENILGIKIVNTLNFKNTSFFERMKF